MPHLCCKNAEQANNRSEVLNSSQPFLFLNSSYLLVELRVKVRLGLDLEEGLRKEKG